MTRFQTGQRWAHADGIKTAEIEQTTDEGRSGTVVIRGLDGSVHTRTEMPAAQFQQVGEWRLIEK